MPELITEEQPRIKFNAVRIGSLQVPHSGNAARQLQLLAELMGELEGLGAAPVLNDGLVGGNCAIRLYIPDTSGNRVATTETHLSPETSTPLSIALSASESEQGRTEMTRRSFTHYAAGTSDVSNGVASAVSRDTVSQNTRKDAPFRGEDRSDQADRELLLVSRSGKRPGVRLQASEFVWLKTFDRQAWSAEYASTTSQQRPTSDSPLLYSCLAPDAAAQYGWSRCPAVALHGHALASGAGLRKALELAFPVSDKETLFSTPEDLAALEKLFCKYPYPKHKCYIRTGHGFFILGQDVAEVAEAFTKLVQPYLDFGAE